MDKDNLGVGILIVTFVAIIIGIIILQSVADTVNQSTATYSAVNKTVTAAANGASVAISGYQDVQGTASYNTKNATAGYNIGVTNFTLAMNPSNGVLYMTTNDAQWAGRAINITATLEPVGYIKDSAGRMIAGLIIIFAALAIAIVALVPTLRERLLDMF